MEIMQNPQLPDVPEPFALKAKAIEQRTNDPMWDSDSLRVWYANKLPSYLWTECGWSQNLKPEGLTWAGFLECLSAWKGDIILWLRGGLSWENLIANIDRTIPRFKPWLDARHGDGPSRYFPLRER